MTKEGESGIASVTLCTGEAGVQEKGNFQVPRILRVNRKACDYGTHVNILLHGGKPEF